MTTELSTSISKQSFITLTGENWDIYKFQTLNYFYEVDGEQIISGKEAPPEELILDEEESNPSSSSSTRKSKPSIDIIEERRRDIKLYQSKLKKMYLYLVKLSPSRLSHMFVILREAMRSHAGRLCATYMNQNH